MKDVWIVIYDNINWNKSNKMFSKEKVSNETNTHGNKETKTLCLNNKLKS